MIDKPSERHVGQIQPDETSPPRVDAPSLEQPTEFAHGLSERSYRELQGLMTWYSVYRGTENERK
jgi:hypothetical protein